MKKMFALLCALCLMLMSASALAASGVEDGVLTVAMECA